MSYRLTVDTGGTFTDVVVSDGSGKFTLGKSLTTPDRIFNGMKGAMEETAAELGLTLKDLLAQTTMLIYGSTRATNAIVTKNVAKTAFLTTEGFPDTLLLKEGGKFNPHDFSKEYPEPYIRRRDTYEIEERTNSDGKILRPLNTSAAQRMLEGMKDKGYEAIAVCFLWSIVNPEHEREIGNLIETILPGAPYTLSHELNPVVREYRRASATAIDASLKPLMQEHLRELEDDIRAAGYTGDILVSTANGGCNTMAVLAEKPIYMVGSGPAMAPIAGIHYSRLEHQGENVIVCDAGGTTFDVGIVRNGRPSFTRDTWIGPRYTGDLLGISAVDMRSIGAGGGSIAWIDDGNMMRVGPQSAGAEPGPACYGRGGTSPTVSDAAVVLGYFDPEFFLGGRMKLDVAAARKAIETMAEPLGLSTEDAAYKILGLNGEIMIRAIQDLTINEGLDPRESTIIAGGGASGINILSIARELGSDRVVLPQTASVLSAVGMQFADIVSEEVSSIVMLSTQFDVDRVNGILRELRDKLLTFHRTKLGGKGEATIEYLGEARYLSQVWELDTPLPDEQFRSSEDLEHYIENFHKAHEQVFSVRDEGSPVETVSWKARLTVKISNTHEIKTQTVSSDKPQPDGFRACYFGNDAFENTPIFRPGSLRAGHRVSGPAVIEETTTTLVVDPGMDIRVSDAGSYLLATSDAKTEGTNP